MTTIDNNKKTCTIINVFTVAPENQRALFEILRQATEEVLSKMPGYISANLHMSTNKKTVTNYAQWASYENVEHMLKDENVQRHMKLALEIAIEVRPGLYDVIWSHGIT